MVNNNISFEGYVGSILYELVKNTDDFVAKYKRIAIEYSQESLEYKAFRSDKLIFETRHYMILSNPNIGSTRELNIREFPENNHVRAFDIYFTTRDYNDIKDFVDKQYSIAKEQYQRGIPDNDWEVSCRTLPSNIEEMYFKFNFKPYSGLNKLLSHYENREYQVFMHILYKLK